MANSSNASHPIAALRQERAQAKSHPQTHKATSLQKRSSTAGTQSGAELQQHGVAVEAHRQMATVQLVEA
jgi:hypothetical protein